MGQRGVPLRRPMNSLDHPRFFHPLVIYKKTLFARKPIWPQRSHIGGRRESKIMRDIYLFFISMLFAPFLLIGCGSPPSPLDDIREALKGVPTYSIVLDNMKTEGNIFQEYYHKYKIISEEGTRATNWAPVSKKIYDLHLPLLGMTIWTKQDGKESSAQGPPGYEYVGNPRYGQWNSNSSGASFWVFYGQYRLLGDLLGRRPIYQNQHASYRSSMAGGRPYYGPNREYGTNGSVTQRQKPNFYNRRMAKTRVSKSSFSDKVNRRIGRTRSGFAGRSGRGGK